MSARTALRDQASNEFEARALMIPDDYGKGGVRRFQYMLEIGEWFER
jgi:hypothetical protein